MTQLLRHPLFPQDDDILYLNHAAISPWPKSTSDIINDFTEQNCRRGSKNYLQWLDTENQLRERLRQLINADSIDDIALLKNTSEGLSVIAYGLEWNDGDNVIIPKDEFPSNRIVWESLSQMGVETRQVDILSSLDPEQTLMDAVDSRTRLVSVSAVQYHTGFKLDLEKIGLLCRQHNVLYVIDAIQHLGALVFDNKKIQADFIVADGHKWMMGPEGLALFYSSQASRQQLNLKQYGWRMIEDPHNLTQQQWTVTKSAQRFECGSPNMLGIFALNASVKLLLDIGIEQIQHAILTNSKRIREYINQAPDYELISQADNNRCSGITTFRHLHQSNQQLFNKLCDLGVQCAIRGNGIRFSPHYYHQTWEFKRLFNILNTV